MPWEPEANTPLTQKEIDKFHRPVFGKDIEDIHNTRNGFVPGHEREGEDPEILYSFSQAENHWEPEKNEELT